MTPTDLDQLADLLAERLANRPAAPPRIVDAAGMAEYLGVSRDVIYSNADVLGAIRLGKGERPRLRFVLDAETVHRWRQWGDAGPPAPRPSRRPARSDVPLLPIGGRR